MKRRSFLKSGLAATSLVAAPSILKQAYAATPVTIHGLKSMSGAFASYGQFAEMGFRFRTH